MRNLIISAKWSMVVLVMLLSTQMTVAQFNIKVGYNLGFVSPDVNNSILEAYNEVQGPAFDDFNPIPGLNLVFGVNLGLRYKFEFAAITFDWEGLNRSISSVGFTNQAFPNLPISSRFELNYGFNNLMVGLETSYGRWGIGSNIGRTRISLTRNTIGDEEFSLFSRSNVSRNQYFARFHLSIDFIGNRTVAFSIRPFIHIPITDIDLSPIAQELQVSVPDTEESFPMFGLSFSFYNGRQKR